MKEATEEDEANYSPRREAETLQGGCVGGVGCQNMTPLVNKEEEEEGRRGGRYDKIQQRISISCCLALQCQCWSCIQGLMGKMVTETEPVDVNRLI